MKFIISSVFMWCIVAQTSIYTLSVNKIDNGTIILTEYQGKKIMMVNIATGSTKASQLAQLQQLQDQYQDSLVIIGFPSNSFGNEARNNPEIKQFCQSNYGVNFTLAKKGSVKGTGIQPVYNWLTKEGENGASGSEVKGDFQKFIIDRQGNLVAVFAGSVSPLSEEVINAVTSN